jgi:uncharacterized coiled-coil protein SlyX
MTAQRTGERAAESSRLGALAERVDRLWRRGRSRPASKTPAAEVDEDRRLKRLEARVEHLETALEGLQDALYRHQILDEENIGELRRRMEPEQMARDLSDDARRRGL